MPNLPLTDDEITTLILSCCKFHGDEGVTQDQMRAVIDWAQRVRAESAMLSLVLEGRITAGAIDAEMCFRQASPPMPIDQPGAHPTGEVCEGCGKPIICLGRSVTCDCCWEGPEQTGECPNPIHLEGRADA